MKKNEEKQLSLEEEVTRDCPLLFEMADMPCTETCMCWGFECGEGWHEVICKHARMLEMLNMVFYPKCRVRIQADQIKEKFGTLRFYYSVVVDPNCVVTWLMSKIKSFELFFSNHKKFDYALKKIVDVEPFNYDERRELSKKEFDQHVNSKTKCINCDYIEENGKYFEICHLENYGKFHYVPTKNKLFWHFRNMLRRMHGFLDFHFAAKETAKTRNCVSLMNSLAEMIVKNAENECAETCEFCGSQIGTSWSPACETVGWIRYICEDCAKKHDMTYHKNGKLWHNGIQVKKNKKPK